MNRVRYKIMVLAMFSVSGVAWGFSPKAMASLPALSALAQQALTKITAQKLTLRNYFSVKQTIKALSHGASAVFAADAVEASMHTALKDAAIKNAVGWSNYQRYNPLFSFDLYNPLHIGAAMIAFYAACRVAETYIVVPLYKKLCKKDESGDKE